jgi:Holliday junction resolvasome RuvABC endonuclease subunit
MMMLGMSVYIGVDPSLNRPGLAILKNGLEIEFLNALSVSRKLRGAERLATIFSWAASHTRFPLGVVTGGCIEGPSLGSTHREFDLGEASGALKVAVFEAAGVELQVIEPTRLKKFATGNGQASKAEVIHAVKVVFGIDLGDDDDSADALMLARLAWALDHKDELRRRCELEVVTALQRGKPKRRSRAGRDPENI